MKIDVYQEQYKSKQAYHQPGQIGFGYDVEQFKNLGNTMLNATVKKFENDDALNSARIEADTVFAADKMLREFKETADPDNFEADMEKQRNGIQQLIKDQSKNFKLPKSQTAFTEKMTRGLEEKYIEDSLQYSYGLQETRAQELVKTTFDSWKAQLLAGNSLITVHDVMQNMNEYWDQLATRYHIPADKLQQYKLTQNKELVTSYAYGLIDTEPEKIRDMLLGNNFDKFKEAEAREGNEFTMEDFWANDELQEKYRQSEYGANWINVSEYLDYPTRMALWQAADGAVTKKQQEELKRQLAANAMTDADLDMAKTSCKLQAEQDGTLPAQWRGASSVTSVDDPGLGTKDEIIKLGQAKTGPLSKGHSITKEGKTFADGLDGGLRGQGYETYITSNLRPEQTGSAHKDGSAADIQVFRNGQFSIDGSIKAYAEAVKKYGNHMRKGATLFEVDPAQLPYIKQQLTKMGIDPSYVNWDQSAKYGETAHKEGRPHVHFGIDPKADYTKTSSGSDTTYNFETQYGKARYMQQRAAGKDPRDAYAAAKKDENDILVSQRSYNYLQQVINSKDSNGNVINPANYGDILVQIEKSVTGNTKLNDAQRIRELEAINYLKQKLPAYQKQYTEDPNGFIQEAFKVDQNQATQLQQKLYGVSPEEVNTMSDEKAKTVAANIERMAPEQAITEISKYNTSDLKTLSKYFKDGSKSNMLLYANMASPKLRGDMVSAIKDWDSVKKYIEQNKDGKGMLPKQWKNAIMGDFRSNPAIKKYLEDVKKLAPQEETKILDVMTSLYAYEAYAGATDRKAVVKKIADNLIANNYHTVSVSNPSWGNTQVNVSAKKYSNTDLAKIKRACDIMSSLGVNPNKVGAFDVSVTQGSSATATALRENQQKSNKHNHDMIVKTATLSGTPNGTALVWTRTDLTGEGDNTVIRDGKGQPLQISLDDLIKAYDEANSMAGHWNTGETNQYGKPQNGYKIPGTGKFYSPYAPANATKAFTAAFEHVITNKYQWLNTSDYTQFKKLETDYKTGKSYDVIFDATGKQISRKERKNNGR